MSCLCRLFGHRTERYGYREAYGRAEFYTIDNLGTEHWNLTMRCSRCGDRYTVAKFHGPLATPEPSASIGVARRNEICARHQRASGAT